MPHITQFLLCDTVRNGEAGIPQLVSPQLVLQPQFIPGNYSFGISIGIQALDMKIDNQIELKLISPDDTVTPVVNNKFPAQGANETLPEKERGIMLSVDVRNLPISIEGEYRLSVLVNGITIGEKIIPIYKRG